MDRFGILDQLMDNWPGKIGRERIQLLERKTRDFTPEELSAAVDEVLDTCTYPPNVKDFKESLFKVKRRRERKLAGVDAARTYRPGDVVNGQQTFTPAEAAVELERMKLEYPEAFSSKAPSLMLRNKRAQRAMPSKDLRASMEQTIHRIYIKALRKCVSLDPNAPIVVPEQNDLF